MQATYLETFSPPAGSRSALKTLLSAIALGVGTQLLFFRAGVGLNWFLWDALVVAATLATLSEGRLRPTAAGAAAACLVLGFAVAFRGSAFTATVAVPTNLALLLALPVIVGSRLTFAELGSVPERLVRTVPWLPRALGRIVTLPRDAIIVLDGGGRNVIRRALAGLVLGVPLAAVFTLLLSADASFANMVGRLEARVSTALWFVLHAAVSAIVYVVAHALFRASSGNADDGATPPPDAPYRTVDEPSALPHVSSLTWGIVLSQVALVFLAYALVHRDTEFGGHALVRGRADLTYSSHLHAGFHQLLLATGLAVFLVVAGHRILRARGTDPHVPGPPVLVAIEAALLVLTGLTLLSCVNRLRLYEEAYGATHLRIGVAFIALAAFAVLICTLAKAIFRRMQSFGATAMTSLTACAIAASLFDADGYIARANLDRAARGHLLDEQHLATLSADACVAADHPVLRNYPSLRRRVVAAWRASSHHDDVRDRRGLARCPDVDVDRAAGSGFGAP